MNEEVLMACPTCEAGWLPILLAIAFIALIVVTIIQLHETKEVLKE